MLDQYVCADCGVAYKRKYHLQRHTREKHFRQNHSCHVCGVETTRREHVKRHLHIVHHLGDVDPQQSPFEAPIPLPPPQQPPFSFEALQDKEEWPQLPVDELSHEDVNRETPLGSPPQGSLRNDKQERGDEADIHEMAKMLKQHMSNILEQWKLKILKAKMDNASSQPMATLTRLLASPGARSMVEQEHPGIIGYLTANSKGDKPSPDVQKPLEMPAFDHFSQRGLPRAMAGPGEKSVVGPLCHGL